MLSLEQIRTGISQLRKLESPEEIHSGIEDIFRVLLRSDQPLYLSYSDNTPFIAPSPADKKHLYLRLFSHPEVADKYKARNPTADVREATYLDVLQTGHWALRAGAYGFILNESDMWVGITIPDFLRIFFRDVCHDETLYDETCAELLLFINEMRKNEDFLYGAVCDDNGNWVGGIRSMVGQVTSMRPLSIQSLFHAPTETLQIETERGTFNIPNALLLKGLSLCGLTVDHNAPLFPPNCLNDNSPPIPFTEDTWKAHTLSDISLVFAPTPPPEEDIPTDPPTTDDNLAPDIETGANESKSEGSGKKPSVLQTAKTALTAAIMQKWAAIREKLPKKKSGADAAPLVNPEQDTPLSPNSHPENTSGSGSDSNSGFTPLIPTPHEESSEIDPFESPAQERGQGNTRIRKESGTSERENAGEENAASEEKKGSTASKKKRKQHLLVGICLAALVILSVTAVTIYRRTQNYNQFCAYITEMNYADAYTLYRDKNLGSQADEFLSDTLDDLVLMYANNQITAEELAASFRALSNFPSLGKDLEMARLMAGKLEESKNAYVEGKNAPDVYSQLSIWRNVIGLDSVNYDAVQQSIADNEEKNIDALCEEIEYYRKRVRDFAKDRYEVLAYWYPDCGLVEEYKSEFTTEQSSPLSYYPISISGISIHQHTNGYWSMTIDWRNTSVKTITKVCFSVVAIGEDGEIVKSADTNGEWTIFDATDTNVYEPGESPASEEYTWYRVFYGPFVNDVKLTAVNVTFRDGSTSTYTSDIDINRILSSQT